MLISHLEYLGFNSDDLARIYTLRARIDVNAVRNYTVAIPMTAFLTRRVRYQDAPEICFLKLQRELRACADDTLASHFEISDAELEDYRSTHSGKPAPRKPRAPVVVPAS